MYVRAETLSGRDIKIKVSNVAHVEFKDEGILFIYKSGKRLLVKGTEDLVHDVEVYFYL